MSPGIYSSPRARRWPSSRTAALIPADWASLLVTMLSRPREGACRHPVEPPLHWLFQEPPWRPLRAPGRSPPPPAITRRASASHLREQSSEAWPVTPVPAVPTSRTAFIITLAEGRMLRARRGSKAVFREALRRVGGEWRAALGGGGAGSAEETTLEGQPRKQLLDTIPRLHQPLPSQGSSPELSLHRVGPPMRGPHLPPIPGF